MTAPAPDAIAVVDDANRFVRWETRTVIHEQRLAHRSIYVLLFDHDDRVLLQRRAYTKLTWPGYWDFSVAGHVEASDYIAGPDEHLDRVYRDVAGRELAEELGVDVALTEVGHFPPREGVSYEHARLYFGRYSGEVVLQEEEVAEVTWVDRAAFAAIAPKTNSLDTYVLAAWEAAMNQGRPT